MHANEDHRAERGRNHWQGITTRHSGTRRGGGWGVLGFPQQHQRRERPFFPLPFFFRGLLQSAEWRALVNDASKASFQGSTLGVEGSRDWLVSARACSRAVLRARSARWRSLPSAICLHIHCVHTALRCIARFMRRSLCPSACSCGHVGSAAGSTAGTSVGTTADSTAGSTAGSPAEIAGSFAAAANTAAAAASPACFAMARCRSRCCRCSDFTRGFLAVDPQCSHFTGIYWYLGYV